MPTEKCPTGLVALPGDTVCRSLEECTGSEDDYGGIPIDALTVFVKQGAVGTSDGSRAHPYARIQDAIDAASHSIPPRTMVAIAPGIYVEKILLTGKVSLWGACPSDVKITFDDASSPVLYSNGSLEIHRMTIEASNEQTGVYFEGQSALLDRVYVTGSGVDGIRTSLAKDGSSGTVAIQDSLIDGAFSDGSMFLGGPVSIARTVIRQVRSTGIKGNGDHGSITLDHSVIENVNLGIDATAMDVQLTASVIHHITPPLDGDGAAITVPDTGTAKLVDSFVDDVEPVGLLLYGGRAEVTRTTIRNVKGRGSSSDPTELSTIGAILVQAGELDLTDSLVDVVLGPGIVTRGARANVLRSIIRDTSGPLAYGVVARLNRDLNGSQLDLRDSLLLRNGRIGAAVYGSNANIDGCLFDSTIASFSALGDAVAVANTDPAVGKSAPASAAIHASFFRANPGAALVVSDSTATLSSSVMSCNGETWVTTTPPIGAHVQATLDACGCGTLTPCAQ
jgi:hypothetical protein